MRRLFTADYYFDNIYQITPEFLKSISVDVLTADLDNTIADYDTPDPTPEILDWFEKMREGGIRIAIVSNNNRARVERFCKDLGIPCYWKSGKPGQADGALRQGNAGNEEHPGGGQVVFGCGN